MMAKLSKAFAIEEQFWGFKDVQVERRSIWRNLKRLKSAFVEVESICNKFEMILKWLKCFDCLCISRKIATSNSRDSQTSLLSFNGFVRLSKHPNLLEASRHKKKLHLHPTSFKDQTAENSNRNSSCNSSTDWWKFEHEKSQRENSSKFMHVTRKIDCRVTKILSGILKSSKNIENVSNSSPFTCRLELCFDDNLRQIPLLSMIEAEKELKSISEARKTQNGLRWRPKTGKSFCFVSSIIHSRDFWLLYGFRIEQTN
jgi:hypothetical protein